MIFKKIEPNNFDRVFNLLSKIGNDYIPPLNEQVNNMEIYIQKIVTNADTFIIIDNNCDIGILSIYCNNLLNKKAFITTLGIATNYKGQGIAKKLLLFVIEYVKLNKFEKIALEVNKNNIKAINFYKKSGFSIVTENKNSLFMELKLLQH